MKEAKNRMAANTKASIPRTIAGLPDAAVRESQIRVKSAIINSGFEFPRQKLVINMAPADLRKEGSALDLPIALGVLTASGVVPSGTIIKLLALGELSLDGSLRPVRGALPTALLARRLGLGLMLPHDNAREVGMVEGLDILPVDSLDEAVAILRGENRLLPRNPIGQFGLPLLIQPGGGPLEKLHRDLE